MNMTREIKFRIWDKDNNKMLHYDNDIVPCITLNGVLQDCSKEVSSNVSYKYELMQFTGLKDKNGKEIFEGDIMGEVLGGLYVKWCDKCKQFQLHILNLNECMACGGDLHWSEFVTFDDNEVIGNIYENKELVREYL